MQLFSYEAYPEIRWEEFQNKRILITGASGMIGSALIRMLLDYNKKKSVNIKVVGVSRNQEKAVECLKDVWGEEEFTFVSADVNQPLPELGMVDYIIHGAGNTHPRAYAIKPIETITANVIGTKNLLDYASEHGCTRFVFLSSVEIYGENRGDTEMFTEEYLGYLDCNTMRAGYPEGKRVGESLCNAYGKQKGVDFIIPRLSRIYGPTVLEEDSKAISQFIHKAVAGEDIVLKSKGDQLYSYTYVQDCVAAVLLLILEGKTGEAYNVSDRKSIITLAELAKKLAQIAGTKVIYEFPDSTERAGYSTATKAVLDATKLETLGWTPKVHLEEGLRHTVEYLKQDTP